MRRRRSPTRFGTCTRTSKTSATEGSPRRGHAKASPQGLRWRMTRASTSRRSALVLGDFDPRAATDGLVPHLDLADAPHVEAHRRIELERVAARRRLRRAEGDADLLAKLVQEHQRGFG